MTSIQYNFTQLNDVKVGELCNVFGIVKFFTNAKKTKGKDYQMTVSITDSSLGYDSKLVCNLFNERPENLPRITGRGDVVIIHKLKINKYKDKPQGIGIQKQGYNVAVFSKNFLFDLETDSYENIIANMKSNKSHFNITIDDLKKVQELQEWGDSMPSSEIDDEFNLDALEFVTLSEIVPKVVCPITAQVISVLSINYLEYQTLLLIWDGTVPACDLSKKFIPLLSNCAKEKHDTTLMAKLNGKVSSPYLGHIFLKEETLLEPGDYIYFQRVFVEPPINGPGVCLIADQCKVGILTRETQQFERLYQRLENFRDSLPCIADCISSDLQTLTKWSLKDYGKMLKQFEAETDLTNDKIHQFNITSRVVKVHPSTEKEFYESILFYCTCCQELKSDESLKDPSNNCRKNLVPIPMITLILEDFTGWLTGVIVGQAVLNMLNLVMIDANQSEWWIQLFSNRNKESVDQWISHLNHLTQGWIEGKLVFKRALHGKVIPFIQDLVILDY